MTVTTPAPAARPSVAPAPVWRAVHAYCHRGKVATDRLLVQVVGPTVRDLRARGLVDRWFFLRYWHGGPHVRVRLAGTDPAALDRASAELRDRLRAHLGPADPGAHLEPASFYAAFGLDAAEITAMGWNADGCVVEDVYEPELDRYGGAAAIGTAEGLFQVSSEIALAVVAATPTDQARSGQALELLLGFCDALYHRPADAVRWLREYAVMWRYLDPEVAAGSARMRAAAEASFVADRSRLVQRRAVQQGAQPPRGARHWATAAGRVVGWLRDHEDQLSSSPDAVMVSQLHMLANRLGLTASDEVYLVWLASLVLAAPNGEPDHFADGVDAPDRALHEQSKFRPSAFDAQRPLSGPPLERSLDFASGEPLPLPVPAQADLARPLHEVISARRSARQGYRGALPLTDLSALLGYGAGFVGTELADVDGERQERGVRAVPSAGAAYPTLVRIAAFDVTGLRPAVYEYLPQRHAVQQVAQLPPVQALLDCSPFFLGDPPRIDVAAAPAVLFLGADVGALRVRYGLRAARFATLELGHLAQNVLLVATALGLPAAPVGGFFDDAACELVQLDSYDEVLGYLVPLGGPRGGSTDDSNRSHTEGAQG